MNLFIDNSNIESSFDRIAKELLNSYSLFVNNAEIQFTEIEFYYYYPKLHEDNYTHRHKRTPGEWRFHNQGIDITLLGNNEQDGGILIRGIKHNNTFINGPRKILSYIFKHFNNVDSATNFQLKQEPRNKQKIIKTFRHLPNKIQEKDYHNKYYRYLVELEKLKINNSIKSQILEKHITL